MWGCEVYLSRHRWPRVGYGRGRSLV